MTLTTPDLRLLGYDIGKNPLNLLYEMRNTHFMFHIADIGSKRVEAKIIRVNIAGELVI